MGGSVQNMSAATIPTPISLFWFRRDLRLFDNAGLYHALKGSAPVLPLFIFDRIILDQLGEKNDNRVKFIHDTVTAMKKKLESLGSGIEVHYGKPVEVIENLMAKYRISAVYANHDYEPYAISRDEEVLQLLNHSGIAFHTYKDQVIFDKSEVTKDDDRPYSVFTPYSRKWKARVNEFYLSSFPVESYLPNLYENRASEIPTLAQMGLTRGDQDIPSAVPDTAIIRSYDSQRDYPAIGGTSRIGIHLRFGTVSIRQLVRQAINENEVFLNELIWREFYQMILWHFPRVGKGRAFKSEYEDIQWRNDETEFTRWCEGSTGYPIVDAGMRQLNATGFMHNRVRMITASFLVKHLLIDWRWGEAYFAGKLLDYDLASNNGGWQWAAGSGCDAAPYFRIFNPTRQTMKFDPDMHYIRKWVPEFDSFGYPEPIVNHEFARKRCLEVFAEALNGRPPARKFAIG